jgi:hypothetical protein
MPSPQSGRGKRIGEVVIGGPDLVGVLAHDNADTKVWLPANFDPEDIPAIFSLDFGEGSVGIGVEEGFEQVIDHHEVILRSRQFCEATVEVQVDPGAVGGDLRDYRPVDGAREDSENGV